VELSDEELEHLERLARVQLSGPSREKLREQLARIIDFVRRLQSVDTATCEPGACARVSEPALRADEAKPGCARNEVLAEAPRHEHGFFAVPPVIEADEL
jgi:aspartyl-tRNA(Asn)/glutamyl-tRNA(Gln) amidotransferase subunit C